MKLKSKLLMVTIYKADKKLSFLKIFEDEK